MAKKSIATAKKLAEKRAKKKMELWEWLLANGWYRPGQPIGMNCLVPLKKMKNPIRFNFKDDHLRMEVKLDTTKEQRAIRPRVNKVWATLDEDTYENTSLDENGPVFIHAEVKKASPKGSK